MERRPLAMARSPWEHERNDNLGGVAASWFRRRVGDGALIACVANEPHGWHLSISFRDHRGRLSRYPTWDEIADARDVLLPPDLGYVMHLPRVDQYVALHDTTFHVHEYPERGAP